MTRPHTTVTIARFAALTFVLLAGATQSGWAQRSFGTETVTTPAPTDEGSWQGTWVYGNRDVRIVLWLRDGSGKIPEASLNYFDSRNSESFKTDWSGQVDYVDRSRPGHFALRLIEPGADGIEGTWELNLGSEISGRTEKGHFRLYRGGDGRLAVMNFDEYEMVILGAQPKRSSGAQAWTFRKTSRRLVDIEELPL